MIKEEYSNAEQEDLEQSAAALLMLLDEFLTGDMASSSYADPMEYLNLEFEITIKYSDTPVITDNHVKAAPSVSFEVGRELGDNAVKYRIMDATGSLSAIGLTSEAKSVTIPDSVGLAGFNLNVNDIAQGFMKGNKKTKTVKVGSNVTSIGSQAFYKCKKLKKVTIKSKQIKTIGNKAFGKDAKNFTLKLPKSCKKKYRKLLKKAKVKF